MNLFEKLQKVRCDLQNKNLKKSGRNRFSGYDYYELGDFLPTINAMCLQEKICTAISFTAELATLSIYNAEKPEEVLSFSSPMATVTLKGCHDIQNLGAVETYQRRYLYMSAFEIVEHDELDAVTGSSKSNTPSEPKSEEASTPTTGAAPDGRARTGRTRTEQTEETTTTAETGRRSRTPRVEAEQVPTEEKPIDKANAIDVTPTDDAPRRRRRNS
jgi:hypothetical protein